MQTLSLLMKLTSSFHLASFCLSPTCSHHVNATRNLGCLLFGSKKSNKESCIALWTWDISYAENPSIENIGDARLYKHAGNIFRSRNAATEIPPQRQAKGCSRRVLNGFRTRLKQVYIKAEGERVLIGFSTCSA
ncbi:hypothetical protein CC78DRAFT_541086 [Lojkania enalia]|uniref:Uncharacterized protein n=1 Tax=Lojkania enalia TaxID=147567 RepID=A0A9P4KJC6_9PLEO|nr:hypothetical protein CC78DRAFT_541086 [Didymosphaeria enalia]